MTETRRLTVLILAVASGLGVWFTVTGSPVALATLGAWCAGVVLGRWL